MVGEDPTDREVRRLLQALPDLTAADGHVDDAVLVAYHDGALDEAAVEAVDRHLAACSDCRDLLVDLGEPVDQVAVARAVAAAQKMHRDEARGRDVGRVLRWVGGGGLGLAAAAAAVVLVSSRMTQQEDLRPVTYDVEQFQGVVGMRGAGPGGEVAPVRGDQAASRRFLPDTAVAVTLRPSTTVPGQPVLAVYASKKGLPMERVPTLGVAGAVDDASMLTVRSSAGGSFVLRGVGRQLFRAGPGAYVISFVIARAGSPCLTLDGRTVAEARAGCGSEVVEWEDVEASYSEK